MVAIGRLQITKAVPCVLAAQGLMGWRNVLMASGDIAVGPGHAWQLDPKPR